MGDVRRGGPASTTCRGTRPGCRGAEILVPQALAPQALATRLAALALVVVLIGLPGLALAQVQQGATVTVLRGEIAVVSASGAAVQPAPSGTTVGVGDEIRTIGRASALVTFFAGTEIELGADTILVVEQLSKDGDRIDIELRQVLGATVHRVQTLAGSGSTYQIQAGGAVALVRGTTFGLVGPVTTSVGDVVSLACTDDCTGASSFAGCAMGPYTGHGVVTSGGRVASDCVTFGVARDDNLFDAATQGVTTTEQKVQGDTRGAPAGQVAAGQRQEAASRSNGDQQEKDREPPRITATPTATAVATVSPTASLTASPGATSSPTTTPTRTPTTIPVQSCNVQTVSGGAGTTTTTHQLGQTSGSFRFSYQAFSVPDRFQVIYEGNTLLDTGSVSGGSTKLVAFSGAATTVTVIVTGPPGTSWNYTVNCPT
jgi:hypothetical protein